MTPSQQQMIDAIQFRLREALRAGANSQAAEDMAWLLDFINSGGVPAPVARELEQNLVVTTAMRLALETIAGGCCKPAGSGCTRACVRTARAALRKEATN